MEYLRVPILILLFVTPRNLVLSNTGGQAVTFSMRKVAFSSNQFGIDLFRALNISNNNVALCPFCIGSSLAMILLGAEGSTAMALRQALYLWGMHPQEIHLAYHDLIAHLGVNLKPQEEHTEMSIRGFPTYHRPKETHDENVFRILNNIYNQRHFSIHYPYQFYLQRYYNTTIHPLDFVLNSEESTQHINAFFERLTDGRVRNVLSQPPSPSTNLLLLNALFFRGTLDMNMSKIADGQPDVGWSETGGVTGRQGKQPIMLEARRARIRYGTHSYLNCTAVEVPFKGGLISLVALLPNDPNGMGMLETRMSAQRLTDIINTMQVKRVNFQMPRITIDQTHGNLSKALFNLGLVDLFTPGYANLFGISNFGWLHVTNITHTSFVEIREAENSAPGKFPSGGTDGAVSVSLDKPFLWFIMDNIGGLAIAMGKMVRPEADIQYHPPGKKA